MSGPNSPPINECSDTYSTSSTTTSTTQMTTATTTTTTTYPTTSTTTTSTTSSGSGIIISGGYNSQDEYLDDVEIYDINTKRQCKLAHLPQNRYSHTQV